ncbi:MAG: 4Fe-4S dicluster domain-containing protein [Elusimicrobia bacterium]|nr:4Fe-4S dicluster domain-containing protein [Elusimicrobiota bacterium]
MVPLAQEERVKSKGKAARRGLTRRDFLAKTCLAGAVVAAAPSCRAAEGGKHGVPVGERPAVLTDLTRCIGCRSCMRACRDANDLPVTGPDESIRLTKREELSVFQWTAVNPERGRDQQGHPAVRNVKRQCMHCLEPACASVCPVGALHQTPQGPVIYRAERCIGCRYCMVACPFEVPRFDWNSGLTPVIGKCQFCAPQRLFEGLPTACSAACPTGALKFGNRTGLVFEARARIESRAAYYVPRIYGEEEIGGTSWLYISDVPFEELGFKKLGKRPLPSLTWDVVSRLPAVALTVAVLLGLVSAGLSKKGEEHP